MQFLSKVFSRLGLVLAGTVWSLSLRAQTPDAKPVPDSTSQGGLVLADSNVRLKLGGYVQAEAQTFFTDPAHRYTNQFLLRRARLDLGGTVDKYFEFRFLPDFGQGQVVIQDAWVNAHFLDAIQLQAGKFKVPFGLEQDQRDINLALVERSLASDLTPVRDVGAELHGDIARGVLHWEGGIFDGAADGVTEDRGVGDTRDFAGRILVQPFATGSNALVKRLAVGIGGTAGRLDGSATSPDLPSYKSAAQQTAFFSYLTSGPSRLDSSISTGAASRGTVHAYWYFWRLGLLSEYVASWQRLARADTVGTVRNEATNITILLEATRDRASYDGQNPRHPFDPGRGHWGAVELVGRFSALHIGHTAFDDGFAGPTTSARQATEWTSGVNWALTNGVRFQLNYERTFFVGGAPAGGNRETEDAVLGVWQLVF